MYQNKNNIAIHCEKMMDFILEKRKQLHGKKYTTLLIIKEDALKMVLIYFGKWFPILFDILKNKEKKCMYHGIKFFQSNALYVVKKVDKFYSISVDMFSKKMIQS